MPVQVLTLDQQETAVLVKAPLNRHELEKLRCPGTRHLSFGETDDLLGGLIGGLVPLSASCIFFSTAIHARTGGGAVTATIFATICLAVAIICLVCGTQAAIRGVNNVRINNARPHAKITQLTDDRRWQLLEQAFQAAKKVPIWERMQTELGQVSDLSNKLTDIVGQYLVISDNQFALLDEDLSDADAADVMAQRSKLVHNTAIAIASAIDTAQTQEQVQELEQQRLELESAEAIKAHHDFELSQRVLSVLMVNDPLIDEIGRS